MNHKFSTQSDMPHIDIVKSGMDTQRTSEAMVGLIIAAHSAVCEVCISELPLLVSLETKKLLRN